MNRLQAWAIKHHVGEDALRELATLYATDVPAAPGGSEQVVQQRLRIVAPQGGHALWRNNNGAHLDSEGRMVRYGLGNDSKRLNDVWKSSDLIGGTSVVIRPQHVGRRVAVLTAVECKEPGWKPPKNDRERAQAAFLATVESIGGIGTFAQSVDDYFRAVGRL